METYTRSEQSQQIPQGRKIENGDTRNDPHLPTDRGVGHVHRFKDAYFHIPIQNQSRKYLRFNVQGNIPVQSTWSVHSSLGVHCSDQGVKLMDLQKGIRIHQYLDDWLFQARSHQPVSSIHKHE